MKIVYFKRKQQMLLKFIYYQDSQTYNCELGETSRYGMDGSVFKSRWEKNTLFCTAVQTGFKAKPALELFSVGKAAGAWI